MAERDPFEREVDPQQQLRQFMGVVKRGWLPIFTCLGLGLLVGISLYFFLPKTWMSTAKIQMRSAWMFEGLNEARVLEDLPFTARARLLEDELRSTEWIKEVLDQLEWSEWTRAKSQEEPAERKFIAKVQDHITARVNTGETGERMVVVTFSWFDKIKAARFCEALVEHWLNNSRETYSDEVDRRLASAEELLLIKKRELDLKRQDLEQFEVSNGINSLNQHQDKQQRFDRLGIDLDQLVAQIAGLQAELDHLDRQLTETDAQGQLLLPQTLPDQGTFDNAEKVALQTEILRVYTAIRAMELDHFTDKWPALKQLKDELAKLVEDASALPDTMTIDTPQVPNPAYLVVKKQRDDIDTQVQGLLASKDRMEAEQGGIEKVLKTLPQVLRQQESLKSDVITRQQIVWDQEMELQPLQDKKHGLSKKGPNAMLPYTELEKPSPAPAPSSAIGWLALAIATLVGLGIAAVVVLGKELFRSSFTHPDQLRRTLRLPVLGEVAPIQTVLEVRRARYVRSMQVAASVLLLIGIGAVIYVCVAHAEELPRNLVEWAMDLRDGLS